MSSNNSYMKEYVSSRYIRLKIDAINYKGGKCIKCGYDRCYAAMDFHHRDPNGKEYSWNKLRKRSWEAIKNELDKCDLLCATCHREIHFDLNLMKEKLHFLNEKNINRLSNSISPKICPSCNKLFKPEANKIKYCSMECSINGRVKIKWPSNLQDLVNKAPSMESLAKDLGVSSNAIRKRLKNH